MCGRYLVISAPEAFAAFYGYPERPNFPARYNVAPTQPVAVVIHENGAPHFRLMRWGFWPSWLKDPRDFPLVINARAETMAEKPTFRGALRYRRCVFLADGFYEWRREGSGRTATRIPFLIRRADGAPMALAGLWETWASPDGSEVDTAAIVTTLANGAMAALHERMPVILAPEDVAAWLDPLGTGHGEAVALCRPCPDEWLEIVQVGQRVNDARNEGPDLILPAADRSGAPRSEEGATAPPRGATAAGRRKPVDEPPPQGSLFED